MSEQHKVNCTCDVCTSGSNYRRPGVNPVPPQPLQDEPMEEAVNELCRTVKIVTNIAEPSGIKTSPRDVVMADASAKKPEEAGGKDDCDSCSNNNTCGPHEVRARSTEPVAGSSKAMPSPQQESSTENESSQEEMIE